MAWQPQQNIPQVDAVDALNLAYRRGDLSDIYDTIGTALEDPARNANALASLACALDAIDGSLLSRARHALSDPVLQHCVRCHNSFYRRHDHPSACVIAHDSYALVGSKNNHGQPYRLFLCCGLRIPYDAPAGQFDEVNCSYNFHATSEASVNYSRIGTNLRRCNDLCRAQTAALNAGLPYKAPTPTLAETQGWTEVAAGPAPGTAGSLQTGGQVQG